MPAGIPRSKWTPLLARSLGFSTLQRLREIMNKGGITAPYLDDKLEPALKLLKEQGFNTTKFESQWAAQNNPSNAANAPAPVSAKKKGKAKGAKRAPAGSAARQQAAITLKHRTGEKLLYRLAELLPVGATNYGRTAARMILEAAGVYDKQNTDEAKALAAFQARGIDITKFRRAQPANTTASAVDVATTVAVTEPATAPPAKPRVPKLIELGLQQIEYAILKEAEMGKRRHVSKSEAQALFLNACVRDGDFN